MTTFSAVAVRGMVSQLAPDLPAVATLPEDVLTREHERLQETWSDGRGFWGWLTTVDHKSIAKRYIITAFLMFIAGGLEAAMMRAQLSHAQA